MSFSASEKQRFVERNFNLQKENAALKQRLVEVEKIKNRMLVWINMNSNARKCFEVGRKGYCDDGKTRCEYYTGMCGNPCGKTYRMEDLKTIFSNDSLFNDDGSLK
jgi:hypothetical protein